MPRKFLLASLAVAGLLAATAAHAQTATSTPPPPPAAITFPIAALGGCASKIECKAYCDDTAHAPACIAFGETHGLMNKEEAKKARDFSAMTGPGGCKGLSCKAYCADTSHESECVKFGKEQGLIKPEEAQLLQDIRQNGGPGSCKSKEECQAYCADNAHEAECRAFAQTHGLTPPENQNTEVGHLGTSTEQQGEGDAKIQAILQNGGPGGCTSKDACRAYCSDATHSTECLAFARDHQIITKDQFDRAKKAVETVGPGGCTGEACRTYCADTSHQDECTSFAKEHGLISQEQAQLTSKLEEAIKTGGPGGCTDAASCKAFCSDSANRETCMSFAQEHGLTAPRPMPSSQEGVQQGDNAGTVSGGNQVQPAETRQTGTTGALRGSIPSSFHGPDGCVGDACKEVCQKNPEACAQILKTQMIRTQTAPGSQSSVVQPGSLEHPPMPTTLPAGMTAEQYQRYLQSRPSTAPPAGVMTPTQQALPPNVDTAQLRTLQPEIHPQGIPVPIPPTPLPATGMIPGAAPTAPTTIPQPTQ